MDIRITLLCLFLFCVVPRSTVGKSRFTNPDLFYFPDQADYLKRANKCPDNMILWLGNGRCYKEGERGPCNVGRVLVIDERLFKPYCKDILQWFFYCCKRWQHSRKPNVRWHVGKLFSLNWLQDDSTISVKNVFPRETLNNELLCEFAEWQL